MTDRYIVLTAYDRNSDPCKGCNFDLVIGDSKFRAVNTDGKVTFVRSSSSPFSVSAAYSGVTLGPYKLAADQGDYEFRFNMVINPRWRQIVDKHFPAILGTIFIAAAVALTFVFSKPNDLQTHILLALFALGGGAFGGEISGFIKTDLTLGQKLQISAGGACAIFVLLFFFAPKL